MKKPGTYIDYHVKYLCTKFGDSSLKNEFRNAKRGRLIKWSIMRIFNEAEPPWSNLSEILGQQMSSLSLKMIREKLWTWEC